MCAGATWRVFGVVAPEVTTEANRRVRDLDSGPPPPCRRPLSSRAECGFSGSIVLGENMRSLDIEPRAHGREGGRAGTADRVSLSRHGSRSSCRRTRPQDQGQPRQDVVYGPPGPRDHRTTGAVAVDPHAVRCGETTDTSMARLSAPKPGCGLGCGRPPAPREAPARRPPRGTSAAAAHAVALDVEVKWPLATDVGTGTSGRHR